MKTFFVLLFLVGSLMAECTCECVDGKVVALCENSLDIQPICPPDFIMRDGAVKVEFEILKAKTPIDWFGIYFRAGATPFIGSHLMYVRQNGMLEIAVYPGPRILATLDLGQATSGKQVLTAQFENNYLEVQMGGSAPLITDKLSHQAVGQVLPAAYCADVNLYSFEMICRDTIEW